MSSSSYNKIGVTIKNKREFYGITLKEFATILGYKNDQVVIAIESGSYRVPNEVLGYICSFLKISEIEIMDILYKEYQEKLAKDFYNGSKQFQNSIERKVG